MTNAERYLKDGVKLEDFIDFVFNEGNIRLDAKKDCSYIGVLDLLHLLQKPFEQLKPTLTEDERVILRNIKKDYTIVARDKAGNLFIATERDENGVRGHNALEFNRCLFQFIKNGEEYEIKELLE